MISTAALPTSAPDSEIYCQHFSAQTPSAPLLLSYSEHSPGSNSGPWGATYFASHPPNSDSLPTGSLIQSHRHFFFPVPCNLLPRHVPCVLDGKLVLRIVSSNLYHHFLGFLFKNPFPSEVSGLSWCFPVLILGDQAGGECSSVSRACLACMKLWVQSPAL